MRRLFMLSCVLPWPRLGCGSQGEPRLQTVARLLRANNASRWTQYFEHPGSIETRPSSSRIMQNSVEPARFGLSDQSPFTSTPPQNWSAVDCSRAAFVQLQFCDPQTERDVSRNSWLNRNVGAISKHRASWAWNEGEGAPRSYSSGSIRPDSSGSSSIMEVSNGTRHGHTPLLPYDQILLDVRPLWRCRMELYSV